MVDYGPHNFGIHNDIIVMIESLYDNSTSALLINTIQGKLFKTTVGVRQGSLLSPILFNVFLEEIMAEIYYKCFSLIYICGIPL